MAGPAPSIERGLPEHLRPRAAEILDEAFAEKLEPVIPARDRRLAFLAHTLRSDNCLVAQAGDELLGLACLNASRGEFEGEILDTSSLGIGEWRSLLGSFGAIRAAILLGLLYSHEAKSDEVYVDFIAVSATARGRGLGSTLLEEVRRTAHEAGFEYVRLDVVDTNPRAKALYEREGFRVIREERLGLLRHITGFGAAYSMERPAARAEDQAGRPSANR